MIEFVSLDDKLHHRIILTFWTSPLTKPQSVILSDTSARLNKNYLINIK